MCFAHIFHVPDNRNEFKKMIAAGSGYNGCATATDLHRDSLLQNNHYGCQYNKFSCECKCIFKKKTKIFF